MTPSSHQRPSRLESAVMRLVQIRRRYAMKTNLQALSDGRLSLEIASADRRKVAETINQIFGAPEIASLSGGTRFGFGGEEFMFHDEQEQPRLISGSEHGDVILTQLLDALEPVSAPLTGRSRSSEGATISVAAPDSSQS